MDDVANNPARFYLYAADAPAAWESLRGQKICHAKFGPGVIKSISDRHLDITFDQPFDERTNRTFQKDALKGINEITGAPLFTSLDIPAPLVEKIRDMKPPAAPEKESGPKVKVRYISDDEQQARQAEETAGDFLRLKEKFKVKTRAAAPPPALLHAILQKLENGARLDAGDIAHLEKKGESTVLVNYYIFLYQSSHDGWDLAQASHWLREEGRPEEAVKMTEGFSSTDHSALSAVMASRGGALRAMGKMEEAEQCCLKAIALDATRPHPYTLLGAISFKKGEVLESEKYFAKARELEAALAGADKTAETR